MSTIYVLNKDGKPLMPTTRGGHVRHLLKEQKARVVRAKPFTIQLLYETNDAVQPLYLGIDPGRTNIGVAVVKANGMGAGHCAMQAAFWTSSVLMTGNFRMGSTHPRWTRKRIRQKTSPSCIQTTRKTRRRKHRVVMAKFEQNKDLKQRLLETETQPIEEDTTSWHDNYWGNCHCPKCQNLPGQNRLGIILMETRDKLKKQAGK